MAGNPWQEVVGAPIPSADAWRMFEDWRSRGQQIGMLYCARGSAASITALLHIRSARNGTLRLGGEGAGAAFNLKEAKFTHGPMQVYPNWPAPPPVEVMALQVYLASGDWLVLAEGMVPQELSPMVLPA